MKKSRILKRFVIGTGTVIPLMVAGVATASFMPGGVGDEVQQWVLNNYLNPLARIQQQFSELDPIFDTMMKVAMGGAWNELESTTGSNAPDPYKVRTTQTEINPGVLTTNPVVRQRDLANLYDQELARSMSALMLGETGKKTIQQEADRTSKIVETSQKGYQETQKLAQQAKSLTVTQDVMKNNSEINSALAGIVTNQAQLTADNHTALLQIQQLDSAIAELSANTSEGIDESNRRARVARQLEIGGETRTDLYIPGLYGTQDNSTKR
ncbi:hypothetical protein ACQ4M3_30770 [Leptolyngbya sp. AN03gr2]|uniref:hypothetical protein n=1 Tax=unclassified Leptolyngbya TaxID=2650499 RepID=UPI003D314ABA